MVLVDARDEMDRHLDDVMDQLIELDALDPSISLSDDLVEFSVVVFGSNPLVATETAGSVLRTAIHAANGGTPDWPTSSDHEAWSVSLVGLNAESVGVGILLPSFT